MVKYDAILDGETSMASRVFGQSRGSLDPRDVLMGFATRCSQSAGTSASSSAPAALASAVGCLKVERKSGYSENLQTTAIFYRENDMENGDDPLELGIACRQTRVCRFFGHSMTEMPDLQQIRSSSHLVSLAYQEMGIIETCVDSCGV